MSQGYGWFTTIGKQKDHKREDLKSDDGECRSTTSTNSGITKRKMMRGYRGNGKYDEKRRLEKEGVFMNSRQLLVDCEGLDEVSPTHARKRVSKCGTQHSSQGLTSRVGFTGGTLTFFNITEQTFAPLCIP